MATIITQKQPSWQVQLATSILAPLIGNYINKAMERSENAYNNKRLQAALAENNPQPEPQVNILGMNNQPQLMQQSGNGWENAARQGMNALADFDMNTANLASPMATTQPTPARVPTMADMNAALIRNAGHASLPTLQAQFNPYIQAQEAARLEQRKIKAGNDIANASPDNRFAEVWRHLPVGDTTIADVNAAYSQYKDTWPQAYNLDTGGQLIQGNRNPVTGEYTPQMTTNRTLTPQQIRDNDYRDRALTQQNNQFIAGQDFTRSENELNRKHALRIAEINAQNKSRYKFQFNKDGSIWRVNQNTGEYVQVNPENLTQNLPISAQEQFKQYSKDIRDAYERIRKLEDAKNKAIANTPYGTTPDTSEYDNQIQQNKNIIKDREDKITALFTPTTPAPTQPTPTKTGNPEFYPDADIGFGMLGTSKYGISSHWNTPRKRADGTTYNHGGTDYPAPKGTHITMEYVGTPMTVKNVVTGHPKAGNYVELEGNLSGHKIEMRILHMDNGSIKVQKGQTVNYGDLIGGVGNTGNSHGKNGGYHMHLETKIDDKPIAAPQFFKEIAKYMPTPAPIAAGASTPMQPEDNGQQTTTPPSTGTKSGDVTAQTQNQGGNSNGNTNRAEADTSPVMFKRESDGKAYSERQIQRWARSVIDAEEKKGNKISLEEAERQVYKYLEEQGFKNVSSTPIDISPIMWQYPGQEHLYYTQQEDARMRENAKKLGMSDEEFDREIESQGYRRATTAQISTTPQVVAPGITSDDTKPPLAGKAQSGAGQPISIPTPIRPQPRNIPIAGKAQPKVTNDANLAVVVGGDTAHSPGPVHTNETTETQQQELNNLNGETSGDVNPQSRDINPYWATFQQPYNFGTMFDGMPNRYASTRRQYNIR